MKTKVKDRRRGFTLIEVMIVIAIILALFALVGVALFNRYDRAKVDMTRAQIGNIKNAMDTFRLDFGRYPLDEEGVAVLWDKTLLDPDADDTKWTKYLKQPIEKDTWGNEWGYETLLDEETNEPGYRIWSLGPDGEEGSDDDIIDGVGLPPEDGLGGAGLEGGGG